MYPILMSTFYLFLRKNVDICGTSLYLFSSPELKVLMVSYCDQSLSSVVRALSTFCFKRLLLQNSYTDFEIISQKGFLGDPLSKLLKPFRCVGILAARDKNRKTFKPLLLNQRMDFE